MTRENLRQLTCTIGNSIPLSTAVIVYILNDVITQTVELKSKSSIFETPLKIETLSSPFSASGKLNSDNAKLLIGQIDAHLILAKIFITAGCSEDCFKVDIGYLDQLIELQLGLKALLEMSEEQEA